MERLGLSNPGRVENALSRSQSGHGRAVKRMLPGPQRQVEAEIEPPPLSGGTGEWLLLWSIWRIQGIFFLFFFLI